MAAITMGREEDCLVHSKTCLEETRYQVEGSAEIHWTEAKQLLHTSQIDGKLGKGDTPWKSNGT